MDLFLTVIDIINFILKPLAEFVLWPLAWGLMVGEKLLFSLSFAILFCPIFGARIIKVSKGSPDTLDRVMRFIGYVFIAFGCICLVYLIERTPDFYQVIDWVKFIEMQSQ